MVRDDTRVVLVVDDQAMVAKTVRLMLKSWTVIGTTRAKTAVPMAMETKPTLALVDLYMPDGWGIDVVRELRQKLPGLTIGMMSGALTHVHTMECIRAGATWFIEKPFDRTQLEDAIARGGPPAEPTPAPLTLREHRRAYVAQILARYGGNKSAAARVLGIPRQTLYYLTKQERERK